MKDKESAVVSAAKYLLANRHRHRTEGNVQTDVEALVRTMRVGTINSRHQMGKDQADIYLPNRRAFIEVKPYPKAAKPEKPQSRKSAESPREQLDRYVVSEIRDQLDMQPTLPGFSDDLPDVPWTGIVTDGANWHVYRYPHEPDPVGRPESTRVFTTNEAVALSKFLGDTLGSEMVGKEWAPEKPGALFSDLKVELDDLYQHLPRVSNTCATFPGRGANGDLHLAGRLVQPASAPFGTRLLVTHQLREEDVIESCLGRKPKTVHENGARPKTARAQIRTAFRDAQLIHLCAHRSGGGRASRCAASRGTTLNIRPTKHSSSWARQ